MDVGAFGAGSSNADYDKALSKVGDFAGVGDISVIIYLATTNSGYHNMWDRPVKGDLWIS